MPAVANNKIVPINKNLEENILYVDNYFLEYISLKSNLSVSIPIVYWFILRNVIKLNHKLNVRNSIEKAKKLEYIYNC